MTNFRGDSRNQKPHGGIELALLLVAASPKITEPPLDVSSSGTDRSAKSIHSAIREGPLESRPIFDDDENDHHRTTLLSWRGDSAKSTVPLLRGGGVLMFVLQLAYLIVPDTTHTGPLIPIVGLHLAGIYFGALLFALTFTDWCLEHWRIAAWFTCAAEILTILALAVLTNDPEALFVAIVGVVIGAGALVPWNARWQGALGAVAVLAFAILSHSARNPDVDLLWLGVLIAVLLAQAACMMTARYRGELEAQVLALSISHRRLGTEMAEHAQAKRRAQISAETMRTVFDNLNDIAIVGTLGDRTFVMVNQTFETAFGLRREALLGHSIREFELWVHAAQREYFVSELEAGRTVRNFEAEFRLGDGRIITGLVSGVPLELNGRLCGVAMIRDITAISETRVGLEQSQARMRTILDASMDAISIYSLRQSQFTYANDGLYNSLGLTSYQVLGHSSSDLNLWADLETMREYDRRIETDGSVRNMEVEFRRADGALIPALISSVKTELDGEPCIISFTREISVLKQKERELEAARAELARQLEALRGSETRLAESEAKLRTIFNANRDFIAINEFPGGEYLEINDEVTRRTGLSREQILRHRTSDFGFWADPAQFTAFVEQLHEKGEVRNVEVNLRIGAEVVPHLISGVLIDLAGRKALLSIARDISEFRAAQQRLAESEATLRKVFDANFDSISISDMATGRYLDVNGQFVRATGLSKQAAIGKPFNQVGLWADSAQRSAFAREIEESGFVRDMPALFRNANGTIAECLISGIVLQLGGRPCCLAISHDITGIKRAERELIAARESALQASRAKSEFLSSMSHEIRTPMNAILGMADLLAETQMTTEQRHYVQNLVSNGHALLVLLSDILDLAKVESGRMLLETTPLDLREVVENAAEAVAIRAHEKGLELLVRIAPGTPVARIGDPLRLRQILINLIGNAIKFTKSGEVAVSVERDRASAEPGALLFSVRDTGMGIAADKLETIFMPFTQADSSTTRSYGGSGLGLAIVRRLAALMRAKVWAESEPGRGSVFYFSVTMAPQAQPEAEPDNSLAGKRVLVADDNAACLAIVREMLEMMGATCIAADSGANAIAAVAQARAQGSSFDAILIDNRMPVLGGIETTQRMRALGVPERAISLMLGSDEISQVRSASLGSWIVKPIALTDLRAAVLGNANPAGARGTFAAQALVGDGNPMAPSATIDDRALRILLADDSADNRILVRAYLKKTPYELDEAENGRVAIDKFISRTYDVVLMDIQMPEIDGYTATRAIRDWERKHDRPRTPILALTASALEENQLRTREAGCDAHITKPVRKATLLEAIHRATSSVEPQAVESPQEKAS